MLTQEDVLGRWTLVAFEAHGDDGSVREPLGPGVVGALVYLDDGWFCGHIESADRAPFGTADPRGGTTEQVVAAFRSLVAYMGRWRLEDSEMVHTVELASLPDWRGGEQRRSAELVGDELVLRTPPITLDGVATTSELRWRRP
jgi:hypothetical protein